MDDHEWPSNRWLTDKPVQPPQMLVLPVYDDPVFAWCGRGEDIDAAIRRHLHQAPETRGMGTQGMGRLRAFFCDDFSRQGPNWLADRLLSAVGYHHPHGWYGPVVITMEEDAQGEVPVMTGEVLATLLELSHGPF